MLELEAPVDHKKKSMAKAAARRTGYFVIWVFITYEFEFRSRYWNLEC